jgi:ribonuclease Z
MPRSAVFVLVGLALMLPIPVRAEGEFKVTLLGTGTPQVRSDRFGPSTLVEVGGQILLFDAGRGVVVRLREAGVPLANVTLFLTHFHSDHTVGIPDLWLTSWLPPPYARRATPFHVIGPVGVRALMTNLERAYARDVTIRIEDEKLPPEGASVWMDEFEHDGVVYTNGGVKVTAFEVDHGPAIKPAYGYRIDYNGRSAVISGDTRYNENVIRYASGVDLLIHEVIAGRHELMSQLPAFQKIVVEHHTTPQDAGKVFSRARPKLAVYTHLVLLSSQRVPEPTRDEIVGQTRETYDGPLEVGEDLMTFSIGDTLSVSRRVH